MFQITTINKTSEKTRTYQGYTVWKDIATLRTHVKFLKFYFKMLLF